MPAAKAVRLLPASHTEIRRPCSRADKRSVVDRDLPVMVAFDPTDAGFLTKLNKVMTSPAL
jgi:hypothetical protein